MAGVRTWHGGGSNYGLGDLWSCLLRFSMKWKMWFACGWYAIEVPATPTRKIECFRSALIFVQLEGCSSQVFPNSKRCCSYQETFRLKVAGRPMEIWGRRMGMDPGSKILRYRKMWNVEQNRTAGVRRLVIYIFRCRWRSFLLVSLGNLKTSRILFALRYMFSSKVGVVGFVKLVESC